jgi:ADP-ribosylglycohydrolase
MIIKNAELIEILNNGKNKDRRKAARELAFSNDEKVSYCIMSVIDKEKSLNVKQELCLSLGNYDFPKIGKKIETMLYDNSQKVRWAAAFSLSQLFSYQALDYISKGLSLDYDTFSLALQSINYKNLNPYINLLLPKLNDQDPFIVSSILKLLSKGMSDFQEIDLWKYTLSKHASVRETVFDILLNYDKNRALEIMYNDKDEIIKRKANFLTHKKSKIIKPYNSSIEDRFIGNIVGGAIGDALGAPIEILTYNSIIRDFGYVSSYFTNERRRDFLQIGEWTDDTDMAISVAKSLIINKFIDPSHIGNLFGNDVMEIDSRIRPERGYSNKGLLISRMLRAGINWRYTGQDTMGCGSVMRTHPIGAFFHDDISNLIENCKYHTIVTHKGNECIDSTILLAYAVARTFDYDISCNRLITDKFYDELIDFSKNMSHNLINSLILNRKQKKVPLYELIANKKGGGRGPIGTVSVALEAFFRHPDDFLKAVSTAINNDGDSDSIGSMTGSLAGSYLGFKKIPDFLVNGLYQKDMLVDLGKSLHEAYREK